MSVDSSDESVSVSTVKVVPSKKANGKSKLVAAQDNDVDEGDEASQPEEAKAEVNGDEVEDSEDSEVYVVEKIIKHRTKGGKTEYFLKWQGYGEEDNTWEREDNVFCHDLVDAYWKSIDKKNSPAKATPRAKRKRNSLAAQSPTISITPMDDEVAFPDPDAESWEDSVKQVVNVEHTEDGLYIHLEWKNGRLTCHRSDIVNHKCPQTIISFYESKLHFKRPTAKEAAKEAAAKAATAKADEEATKDDSD
ncbi:hypothetical protein BJ085DRAFT_17460 [Dimargaris cristalligena]|uniref:Chromo domain-containing protein n=1 Tax=Dimargaris cristalligena TaxID=215637 RepID=A0A4V1J5P7_9FUNG|nr:hypothetical protein BJ085DRAFT_17460 [Dimargaris cristalligena]|eukprot:RKP39799.1 hypothetical protein BJ085DRAFT_17460 [Dimargaris cristalligena]